MKKLVISALALCMGCVAANAQITTGESSAQVIRTGNRAEAGNFGIYLGGTASMFKSLMDFEGTELKALPLLNFKYMVNDNVEARLGLEWWTESTKDKVNGEDEDGDFKTKDKYKETSKFLSPGIAYHFSSNNILDVYVGAELPFGWGSTTTSTYADYDGKDFDVDDETKTSTFQIGLGAFVGLQGYIANLPLAIGLEYGISSLKDVDSRTIVETYDDQKYETDFSNGKWNVGHQARLTLTYFFKM